MTIQQRLEAINALATAQQQLSQPNQSKTNIITAIKAMQVALEALNIETLSVDDNANRVAKEAIN